MSLHINIKVWHPSKTPEIVIISVASVVGVLFIVVCTLAYLYKRKLKKEAERRRENPLEHLIINKDDDK